MKPDTDPRHSVIFSDDGKLFEVLDEGIPSIRTNTEKITTELCQYDPDFAHEKNFIGFSKCHTKLAHLISARGIAAKKFYSYRMVRFKDFMKLSGSEKLPMDSESLRRWIKVLYRYRGQIGNFYGRIFEGDPR